MEHTIEELNALARRRRAIDASLVAGGVLLLVAVAFAGYAYLSTQARDRSTTLSARAVANLTQAVRQNPNDARARILLGDALTADGREAQAIEQYQAALEISKDDPSALAGLARIAMARKEWETAEKYWKRIISALSESQFAAQDLRLEKAYFYLGTTYLEAKRYEEAVTALKEALRLKRDASDTHFLLARAYRELGVDTNYRSELEIALKFDPTMPEANYEFGLLLLEDGDIAGAAEHFRISADNAPQGRTEPYDELAKLGTVESRLEKANSALASNGLDEALVQARIAVAIDPSEVDAVRLLAQLSEKSGNDKAARVAWDRLLTLDAKDAEAREAMKRLDEKDSSE